MAIFDKHNQNAHSNHNDCEKLENENEMECEKEVIEDEEEWSDIEWMNEWMNE